MAPAMVQLRQITLAGTINCFMLGTIDNSKPNVGTQDQFSNMFTSEIAFDYDDHIEMTNWH